MPAASDRQHSRPEAFRFVLRSATRAAHSAVDEHPAFASLLGGTLDIASYQRLMLQIHGFYQQNDGLLEDACRVHSVCDLGFAYHPRAEILAADLLDLGVTAPYASRVPMAGSLPPIGSDGALGGMLYVFEGSLLGGAVLCRAAETLLANNGAKGGGYWRWCREAGAKRWAMTCAMLEKLAANEGVRQEMIDGAQAGFRTFGDWIGQDQKTSRIDGPPPRSMERC